jgi:predicted adenine nucleotide alpha hydrolase (AANH) superfamily ATPase
MIRAKQRAESEANDARRRSAQLQASVSEWRAKFEALAEFVREAADRAGGEHQQEDGCSCRSCWDSVITKIVEKPQASETATGHFGNSAGTFSFDDLFGRPTPPRRN